jgi:flagellar biosynthesis chaperone FliJ
MNDKRRAQLEKVLSQLEDVKEELTNIQTEEQDYLDVMPENLQGGQRGEKSQTAIDAMQEVIDSLEEAFSSLETAKE